MVLIKKMIKVRKGIEPIKILETKRKSDIFIGNTKYCLQKQVLRIIVK